MHNFDDIPLETLILDGMLGEAFKKGSKVKARGKKGVVTVPNARGPLVGIDPEGPDDMIMVPGDEIKRVSERSNKKRKKSKSSHPPQYSAPEGSKRDKQLDATKADLKSGDPERVQRAYRRREKMEKKERDKPGFKNVPRPDTQKESRIYDISQIIEEKLSKSTEKTLTNKAKKRGLTPGSVKSEYRKGLAAWATSGSRKGMTQHQWAMARVNAATPSKPWATVKKAKKKNESVSRDHDCGCEDYMKSNHVHEYQPQRPFVDSRLSDDTILRKFDHRLSSDEYVWHRDPTDREVTVMEGSGWYIQFDNQLPISLREGHTYTIPRGTWHRVIKGDVPMSVMIVEGKRHK